MRSFALLLFLTCSAFAGEYAVFTSGFRMHVDRHEVHGSRVLLWDGAGSIECDAALIGKFEQDDYVAPAAPAAQKAEAPAANPDQLIHSAARKYGLEPKFLSSVVKMESAYRQDAVSPKGAIGLMQLMPSTAKQYGANPHDPKENVETGARYLRELLLKYNGGVYRALAAYNAGPGAVQKYGGVPPYRETLDYVQRVWRNYTKQ